MEDQLKFPRPNVTKPSTLVLAGLGHAYRWATVTTARDMRDNATFLYDATQRTGKHPDPRLSKAKWRRASQRWGLGVLPVMEGAAGVAAAPVEWVMGSNAPGWSTLPWFDLSVGTFGASATVVLGIGAWRGVDLARNWEARKIERRVAEAVRRILGPDADVYRSVRISPDWKKGDRWVSIFLPNSWVLNEGRKRLLESQVGQRLAFRNPVGDWITAGPRVEVTIRDTPVPPDTLIWADVADVVKTLDVHRVLFGISPTGPVILSYDSDSPHSVFSAASGRGKSVFVKMMLAQRLANGTGVILLDHKNSSAYDYVRDLPSNMARVFTRPEMINEVFILLAREMQWRIAAREVDRTATFRKLDVVVEEANGLPGVMRTWWASTGKNGDPPGMLARDQLIFMGREYGIHVHLVAQQASAGVFGKEGGTDSRVNFGIRALAGYEKTTWSMLAYGHPFQEEPEGPVGLWTLVTTKRVDLVRVPFITDEEATRWALRGATGQDRPLTHGVTLPETGETLTASEQTLDLLRQGASSRPTPSGAEDSFTLSEWAKETGVRKGTLEKRVERAGLSPVLKRPGNAGHLFRRVDLLSLSQEEEAPANVSE